MPADPRLDPLDLDTRLRAAAEDGDALALATGYAVAAQRAARAGRSDEAGFFTTHAYVWALVAGDTPRAERLAGALRRDGRLD